MGIIGKIIGGAFGDTVREIVGVVGGLFKTPEDKAKFEAQEQEFQLAIEALLQKRDSELEETLRQEINAKKDIMVAEIMHGDRFVRWARPLIVYVGLLIFLVNSIGPMFGATQVAIDPQFIYVWGGVCGAYILGRTSEKRGARSRPATWATGNNWGSTELDL